MSILEGDRAEVLELTVSERSPLVGVPLKDAALPKGAIVGAIVRGKDDRLLEEGGRRRRREALL